MKDIKLIKLEATVFMVEFLKWSDNYKGNNFYKKIKYETMP